MLLSEGAVEGEQVLNSPVACLVLRDTATVDGVGILVVDTSTGEVAALGAAEVQTDVDAIAQTLNPRALQFTEDGVVGADTLVLVEPYLLVALHCLLGDNALVVGGQRDIALQVAVLIVGAGQRALAQHAIHIVDALILAVAVVGAQTEAEILANHLVEVTANGYSVVTLGGHYRLVVIVTSAEAVAAAVGATGHTHVVVVAHTRLVVQVLPVGVGIVILVQRVLVESGILTHLREGGTVHHGILVEHLLEADVAVVAHLGRCALRTLHGGDDDHTVGTTATIDGRCGGILQDVQRLDVAGVDIRELSHEGNTVEHDQRVVAGTQRALTTDADLHLLARL